MSAHPFVDPVSHQTCTLHVAKGWIGVEHPGCDHPADVAMSIDAFYCRTCTFNGRISGAWASDLYRAATYPPPADPCSTETEREGAADA